MGLALLKKLDAEGLALPTSNAMKNSKGGGKGKRKKVMAEKKKAPANMFMKSDTVEEIEDIASKSNKD